MTLDNANAVAKRNAIPAAFIFKFSSFSNSVHYTRFFVCLFVCLFLCFFFRIQELCQRIILIHFCQSPLRGSQDIFYDFLTADACHLGWFNKHLHTLHEMMIFCWLTSDFCISEVCFSKSRPPYWIVLLFNSYEIYVPPGNVQPAKDLVKICSVIFILSILFSFEKPYMMAILDCQTAKKSK